MSDRPNPMPLVIQRRKKDTTFRSEVARGRSIVTEPYAYRHLAWSWAEQPLNRVAILRIAALACDFIDIPDDQSRSFGRAISVLAYRSGSEQLATKLMLCQNLDLERACQVWRSMMPSLEAERLGFSWSGLLATATFWDQRERRKRNETRRRLLEDFYKFSNKEQNQ